MYRAIFLTVIVLLYNDAKAFNFSTLITEVISGKISQPKSKKQKCYIITGGPGVGKTSIISYLAEQGYATVKEAAQDVIKVGLSRGIKEPWLEQNFQNDISFLFDQRQSVAVKSASPIIFFDRGPIDSMSYMLLFNAERKDGVIKSAQYALNVPLYETTIFLIDDLGFCQKDEIRNESHNESIQISRRIKQDYLDLGFNIVHVPVATVQKRAEFILKHIGRDYTLGKPIMSCIKGQVKSPVGNKQKRYIITGGPSAGKTSIVKHLAERGYHVVEEAAAAVIRSEQAKGIDEPWVDPFFETQIACHYDLLERAAAAKNTPIVFFDRGTVDQVSYMLLLNLDYQKEVIKSTQRSIDQPFYETTVFLIDDLGFCLRNEGRKEPYEEAIRISRRIEQDYNDLGFNVVHIPVGTIEQRVDMIIKCINIEKA